MTTLKPLMDRVLVRRLPAESMSPGGILHIPDNAKEKPLEAEVVAVGGGRILENGTVVPVEVRVGEVVLFGRYAGTEVKVRGEDHLILKEEDILGIVEK